MPSRIKYEGGHYVFISDNRSAPAAIKINDDATVGDLYRASGRNKILLFSGEPLTDYDVKLIDIGIVHGSVVDETDEQIPLGTPRALSSPGGNIVLEIELSHRLTK